MAIPTEASSSFRDPLCQLEFSPYPPQSPHKEHYIYTEDGHTLYVEESGNPKGEPVVVMHGGPGIGSAQSLKSFFDPKHYRIILVDQRGSGKSQPMGRIQSNTTMGLVKDFEVVRKYLKIHYWHVFGGSWGSTLALLYAETFPEVVKSLVLRGIFLANKESNDYFYGKENQERFPEEWKTLLTLNSSTLSP